MILEMKRAGKIAVAAVLLFMSTIAFAQDKDKAAEGAKAVTTQMKAQLALNDGQYTKVLDINKTFIMKAADAETSSANAAEKAKKMKALNDEKEAKLKSVLTETQFKTYAAKRNDYSKKLKEFYAKG